MKKGMLIVIVFLSLVSPLRAEERVVAERFEFIQEMKMVLDTATGKLYGFRMQGTALKHVVIDYINGTVTSRKNMNPVDRSIIEGEYPGPE